MKTGWLAQLLSPPETDSERARTVVGTFVLHLRPVRVPEATIRFMHTFGLGGASLVLLLILALTGSLLMLGYTPVPGDAYASIERLLLFSGAGFHFWRVRKAGGVVIPPDASRDAKGKPEQVLFLPHLL